MAGNSTALFFDIFGRDRGVGRMLDDVGGKAKDSDSKVRGLSGGIASMAAPAAGVLAALGGVAIGFGNLAAEAEQNVGAVETVFGKAAAKVEEFASKSATSVGLSSSQYNQLSAVTGTALKAAGVSVDDLAEKNDELIKRGADMASVFGGTTVDAVSAMGSAFRGEFDPLERYGVTLTMNQVNAELAAKGQDKLGGAALESAKKQAIMEIVMKQSAASAGNFAKEADTTAGAQQRATAAWADASAELGEKMLPVLSEFAKILTNVAKWIADNSELVGTMAAVLGILAAGIIAVTAVQWAWNAAQAANPVGIVILSIAALIAIIVALAMNWDKVVKFATDVWANFSRWWADGMRKLGDQWNGFWGGVNTRVRNTWNGIVSWFQNGWRGFTGWWNDGMRRIGEQWNGFWGGVFRNISRVWNGNIKPVFDTIKRFVTGTIPNAFRDGVGFVAAQWNKLKEIAKAPIRFVIKNVINDGLIKAFNTVAGWIDPGGKTIGRLGNLNIPGFRKGGYTGDGNPDDFGGFVHKGEYVIPAEQTRAMGLDKGHFTGAIAGSDNYIYGPLQEEIRRTRALNLVALGGFPVSALMQAAGQWNSLMAGVGVGIGNNVGTSSVGVGWGQIPGYAVGYYMGRNITVEPGRTDILSPVVTHEVGHALGLGHAHGQSSIMDPMLAGGYRVTGYDQRNLSRLYGGGGTGPVQGIGGFDINPITSIVDGVIGGILKAFGAGNILAQLAMGVGKMLFDDVGKMVSSAMGFGVGAPTGHKVFDGGGWFTEGIGLHNGSTPDAVLTKGQFDDMHTLAMQGGARGDVYVQNPWTGEYMKAKMVQVVNSTVGSAVDDYTYRRQGE